MFKNPPFEVQQHVLHSPFDIETHKKTFKNYLEVIIREDGTVEYAIPSHQEKLISILMKKENLTRQEVINHPDADILDWMDWLCKRTNCISVWNEFYIGNANESQLKKLLELKNARLYFGIIDRIKED